MSLTGEKERIIQKDVLHGQIILSRRKKYVYQHSNDCGYTLVNLLFSLIVYSIIISSLFIMFHILNDQTKRSTDLKAYEWENFINQMQREMNIAEELTVEENTIKYKNILGETVSIHQYKNLIRRQVNGKGHEIFLLKVKNVQFMKLAIGVNIHVISESGKDYNFTFRPLRELSYEE
ncbi:competence type IV pilus minor pilin ComGF [Metabacillus fastidiosus]|uniref:competence type IV pilus minor pilin ComGF n=1 Tax=Metabacillus fastidiosus TaxID=1458 RepID=UPI003D2A0E58